MIDCIFNQYNQSLQYFIFILLISKIGFVSWRAECNVDKWLKDMQYLICKGKLKKLWIFHYIIIIITIKSLTN